MRKGLIIMLCCLMALPVQARGEAKRYEASFTDVFDTYTQLILYADDQALAQDAAQLAHDELKALHQLYDIYNDYEGAANLKTVNDHAGVAPVKVDQRLIAMAAFAKDMAVQTHGRMNIAMGSVLRLWHDCRVQGLNDPVSARLPEEAALKAASGHTAIENLLIDPEASTLYLTDPEMSLDVGAVAKGYAVEQVANRLMQAGVTSALLSVGGNVRAIGLRGDGTPWSVGIQNPDLTAANQNLTKVRLSDLSLVSSGSYQRYYTVNGVQYHHIIDPDTLYPADNFWAVSVVTKDSGLADALSTALFTMPLAGGQALIASWEGVEALWVMKDGSIVRSEGFSALAKEQ